MTVRKTTTNALAIANLGLLVLYLSGWTNPVVQRNKKTIIRRLSILKYPVELSFKVKGEPITSNETVLPAEGIRTNEFEADADWLRDFTISLKNISGKTITYTQVNLFFPEVVRNGRVALQQIHLGVDPDRKFSRPELRLAPNESLEIPIAARYDDIRTLVQTVGPGIAVEKLSKLEIEFHAALFDDETLFETGALYRRNPDPNDPHKWLQIKEK
jgi:hypothetical protein